MQLSQASQKAGTIQGQLCSKGAKAGLPRCYAPRIKKASPIPLNVVGSQVRKLRERKGLNQTQLTTKLQLAGWDTSQGSLSRLENGERRVPDLELFVLAGVLDAKLEDLFPPDLRKKVKSLWPHYRAKLSRGQLPPPRA